MNKKIVNFDKLKLKLEKLRLKRKSIGMSHGVFDLIHLGHIKHFEEAKKNCDILIVSVTSDKFVNKGPGRPKFNEKERMHSISSLELVDYVILSDSPSAVENLNLIKPNIYFKGPDYKINKNDFTKKIYKEINILKKFRGKIIYTKSKKLSSSKLLNSYNQSEKNKDQLLKKIKKKFNFFEIKKIINEIFLTKPFILGETIIDEYVFCEALGKSGKEPILVIRDLYKENYLGGAGAICNHLSKLIKNINFLTILGEREEHIKFIKNKLSKNIKIDYINKKNSPTIVKKRFIDEVNKSKILGVYSLNDDFISKNEEKRLINKFLNIKSDLAILSDYGHGMFTKKFLNSIKSKSKFIAANVQINAANIGHHSLENYKNVDFMIINEKELRHEMRSKNEKIPALMKLLSKKLNLKYLVVTRGESGSILYENKKKTFIESKAYANKVIDKVGAGDTMLAIMSIFLFNKVDLNLSLLISSFCAAQSVKTLGNKESIDKNILLKDLEHYLI